MSEIPRDITATTRRKRSEGTYYAFANWLTLILVPLGAAAGTFLVLLVVNVFVGFSVITITLMLGAPYIVYGHVRRLRAR